MDESKAKKIDINEALEKLIHTHILATEKLTEKQLADAIRQALACGDFQRYIHATGQKVVYIPFLESSQWRFKFEAMRDIAKELSHCLSATNYAECGALSHDEGEFHRADEVCPVLDRCSKALRSYLDLTEPDFLK